METAVKERLIGAVVLVGLIVALVPEMLSGPRRGPENPAASGEAAVRTFTIDLAPSVAQPKAPAADAEGESADDPLTPEPAAAAPVAAPSNASEESPPTLVTARAEARASDRAEARAPNSDAGWAVQLGSFASRENAERLASEVRRGGYRAFVSRFEAGSRVRYRVRVGPEQDRSQAEALARRLQRDGRQVSIVSHP